jgi:hypothetical protein
MIFKLLTSSFLYVILFLTEVLAVAKKNNFERFARFNLLNIIGILLIIISAVTFANFAPLSATATAGEPIKFIDAFPDPYFRIPMLTFYFGYDISDEYITDWDRDFFASETWIGIYNPNVTDLTGIEYFSGLIELTVRNTQITTLDLSGNPLLIDIVVTDNWLTTLDLSGNPLLEFVTVRRNRLTMVDISNNPNLRRISLDNNYLGFNPDLSILGWRNIWETAGAGSGITFYPQYTPDRLWAIDLSWIWNSEFIMGIPFWYQQPQEDGILVVAFYKNGSFKEFNVLNIVGNPDADEETFIRRRVDVPKGFDLETDWTFKVFAWDDFKTMKPIIGSMIEIDLLSIWEGVYAK